MILSCVYFEENGLSQKCPGDIIIRDCIRDIIIIIILHDVGQNDYILIDFNGIVGIDMGNKMGINMGNILGGLI